MDAMTHPTEACSCRQADVSDTKNRYLARHGHLQLGDDVSGEPLGTSRSRFRSRSKRSTQVQPNDNPTLPNDGVPNLTTYCDLSYHSRCL